MDTKTQDAIARIEEIAKENTSTLSAHTGQHRIHAEGQRQIIDLLTPEETDGPKLDELLAQMIGQQKEIIGYCRQLVRTQAAMDQNLATDIAQAVEERLRPASQANGNGQARGNRP